MESQIHPKLIDSVTEYFEKMLSHRQRMTKPFLCCHHLAMAQHFPKLFGHSINQLEMNL